MSRDGSTSGHERGTAGRHSVSTLPAVRSVHGAPRLAAVGAPLRLRPSPWRWPVRGARTDHPWWL